MIYLKPCPFCGEKKIGCDKWTTLDGSVYRFSCAACNTYGPLGHDVKEAQERWNKRISDWTRFDLHPTESESELIFVNPLPEDGENILICDAYGRIQTDIFYFNGIECYLESGTEFSKDLWWKPLDNDDLPKEMTL